MTVAAGTGTDAALLEAPDRVEEVAQRAPTPVQAPHHERVARSQVIKRVGELRSLVQGADA
jgi:hypothetical protein